MVGRSSGWREGEVIDGGECVDTPGNVWSHLGNTRVVLCQGKADYHRQSGDSGGPIFSAAWGPDAENVVLFGSHWGPQVVGQDTIAWFSPLSGMKEDLGSLFFVDPPLYVAIDGPVEACVLEEQEWEALVFYGSGNYTYLWEWAYGHSEGPWYEAGTSASYIGPPLDLTFTLRVTVHE